MRGIGCRTIALIAVLLTNVYAKAEEGAKRPTERQESIGASQWLHPISRAQFQKVLDFLATSGKEVGINPQVTAAFGLSDPGEKLTLLQIGQGEDDADGHIVHTISRLPNDKGYLIARVRIDAAFEAYQVDMNLDLQAAVSQKAKKALITVPLKKALRGLDEELRFWAKAADE